MTISSLAWPLLMIVLALATCEAIARSSPWYRERLAEERASRFEAIDGLRGFLALGVFFAHVMNTHTYYAAGAWNAASVPFYVVSGEGGVALFFMITAFLYWRKVLRRDELDTRALYASRLRRLVPMYLASVALTLAVIFALSGFVPRESAVDVAREVRGWLSFGFAPTDDVNGVKDAHIVNAVYWTLAFEWAFYLALPFLALFRRGAAFALLAVAILFFGMQAPLTLAFLAGMLAAALSEAGFPGGRLSSWRVVLIPLALLALALSRDTAFSLPQLLVLFAFFLFIVDGNTLLGLLATRAARLFGTVSYSFYLLHCVVVFVIYRLLDSAVPVSAFTPAEHWAAAALALGAAIALSALTYRYIEYPFLETRTRAPAPSVGLRQRAAAG